MGIKNIKIINHISLNFFRYKYNIVFIGILLIVTVRALDADAPYERYSMEFSDSLKVILKQTRGILTVNSRESGCDTLTLFEKNGGNFKKIKKIDVLNESVPISNFGYEQPIRENYVTAYRFAVISKNDRYVQVIYNIRKNLSGWLSFEELNKKYSIMLIMFNENVNLTKALNFVSIYRFTLSGKRKVYKRPIWNSSYKIISKNDPKYDVLFVILEIKNGFARIAHYDFDMNQIKETIDPIGWIRIWDDEGMLLIWLYDVDLC
jgi:hypothetical protein